MSPGIVRALRSPRLLLWTAIGAYATGFSAMAVLRHRAFNTGRFDLGNMVQAVWSTAQGHPLAITNLAGEQTSRLAAHFDPILAAFAPLWRLWPSPSVLLTAQAAAISLGALPVFWLARKHLASERAGLGFALAYLLYPPVQWLTFDDFHAVALACPLLLFAFWYLDEGRLVPFALLAGIALLTREEVAFAVVGLGAWYAFARQGWRRGAAIVGAGGLSAAVVIGLVIPHFRDGAPEFYGRYSEVGGSPSGILRTAFSDPGLLVTVALDRAGVQYLAELLLPLGALSVLAPLALVPALPQLALNLLSETPTQTSIHFHYTAAAIPGIVVAAVLGASFLARRLDRSPAALATIVLALSLVANYRLGALPLWRHLPGGETLQAERSRVSAHDRITEGALRVIPPNAVVSASNSLGAHLSARRRILSFPLVQDAAWIALDETRPSYADRAVAPRLMARALARLRTRPDWRLVVERDGVLIFRRRLR